MSKFNVVVSFFCPACGQGNETPLKKVRAGDSLPGQSGGSRWRSGVVTVKKAPDLGEVVSVGTLVESDGGGR